jgi:hypothetical protein
MSTSDDEPAVELSTEELLDLFTSVWDRTPTAGAGADYVGAARAASQGAIDQITVLDQLARESAERNIGLIDAGPSSRDWIISQLSEWGDRASVRGASVSGAGDMSTRLAFAAAEDSRVIDTFMRDSIRNDVDALLGDGGMRRLMEQTSSANNDVVGLVDQFLPLMRDTADSYLRGEIPGDITEQVLQRSGENALRQFGRTDGPAGSGLVARDLGMTSMDVMNMGTQAAAAAAQFAALPIQSAADVTNVLSTYRTPLSNAGAMQQNYLSLAAGGGMVNPNTVLSTGGQVMAANLSSATQIAVSNTQANMAGQVSRMNMAGDIVGAQLGLRGAYANANAQQYAANNQPPGMIDQLSGIGGDLNPLNWSF